MEIFQILFICYIFSRIYSYLILFYIKKMLNRMFHLKVISKYVSLWNVNILQLVYTMRIFCKCHYATKLGHVSLHAYNYVFNRSKYFLLFFHRKKIVMTLLSGLYCWCTTTICAGAYLKFQIRCVRGS